MTDQTNNRKVIASLVLSIIAIPIGVIGWFAMFLVGTLEAVYLPHTLSALASILAIGIGFQGMREIAADGNTQKGRAAGIISIVMGVLNFALLVYYYASY